jgi:hypothetical protein
VAFSWPRSFRLTGLFHASRRADHTLSAVPGYSRAEHAALGVIPAIPAYTWSFWAQNSCLGAIEVENRRETRPITKSAPKRAGDSVVAKP